MARRAVPQGTYPTSPNNGTRPFIFLDKAGVLLPAQPFTVDPARLRFAPGWTLAVERLFRAGFGLATVANESGIALGYYDEQALAVVHRHIVSRFASRGLELAAFLYCPHHPAGTVQPYARTCDCYLPQPGLFRRAAAELGADLRRSWLIGDSADDVTAAQQAHCRVILVDSGHEPEIEGGRRRPQPHEVAPDLYTAAELIVADLHTEAAA